MNCVGIIKFKLPTKDNPLIVPEPLYKECVKRWGEEEVKKMNIQVNQKVPTAVTKTKV